MIRAVLVVAAFFSVTIALLVIQPSSDPRDPVVLDHAVDVTRSDTELNTLAVAEPAASDDALSYGLLDGLLGGEPAPTDNAPAAIETAAAAALRAPQPAPATEPARLPSAITGGDPLEVLVIRALKQGQSTDYIDALVNEAAKTGQVDVPTALVTTDGRVDTRALLSALGGASTSAPQPAAAGNSRYVVEPGDTLASIAFRFYGSTEAKTEIFNANRDRMGSPDQIRVGQELILPAQ